MIQMLVTAPNGVTIGTLKFQADEDWRGAADILARIPLGSSQRNVSDEYKAKLYVRIAMLYLEDDDEVSADSYVARSHSIVGKADFTNLEVCRPVPYAHILTFVRFVLMNVDRTNPLLDF